MTTDVAMGRHATAGWLDDRARDCADRPAVEILGAPSLSWAELREAVIRLADVLRGRGLRPGDRVSMRMRRSTDSVIGLLAIWRRGGVPLLLDDGSPPDWIARRERAAGVRWVFSADSGGLRRADARTLGNSAHHGAPQDDRSSLSHILCTSGTQAEPLAIGTSCQQLDEQMLAYVERFAPDPGDRIALFSGLAHDPVIRDLGAALLSGATIVVPPEDVFSVPRRAGRFLGERRISLLHCTPGTLSLADPLRLADTWRDLRLVLCGGSALPAGLAAAVLPAPAVELVNVYGVSEVPQIASAHVVTEADIAGPPERSVSIGRGFGTRALELLKNVDTPDGQLEVVILTPSVGRELGDRAGEASTSLSPSTSTGPVRFRTGDLAVRSEDGSVRIVGRRDDVLDVNGDRVSRAEVRDAAVGIDGVHEAKLVVGVDGATELLAVLSPDANVAEIRRHLGRLLPPAAVPRRIVEVDRRTIDRNRKKAIPHDRT
ncbi:AMP-binding protein [uncultured Microbacterium sp.]|uniref:AMP-binding protein n=1 Tax=uncultured Microbacterium sp. TaxID=191216 RepID=UPI0028D5CE88|nr:AMP-binding protein [uncultured Microbacterium sp.]